MIGLGNEHRACITGALWAKRGERDILREARDEHESRDEGRRNFSFPPLSRASRKILRSRRLAHKALVNLVFNQRVSKNFLV